MKAHELAKVLLEGENLEVIVLAEQEYEPLTEQYINIETGDDIRPSGIQGDRWIFIGRD